MEPRPTTISVCICTYRRPLLLQRLLEKLAEQRTDNLLAFSVVVCDNDAGQSARAAAEATAHRLGLSLTYVSEPQQNIALARNRAVAAASGEFIAFIDDDEFPVADWLLQMLTRCEEYGAAGMLGPVRPHFDQTPPQWLLDGKFCERPEYPTGRVLTWEETRTGNVLFRRAILEGLAEPFRPELGTGGEDKDFFMRMIQQGHVFRWCNEAAAYETVPPERWRRSYLLKRAMLRGNNILKIPAGRAVLVAKSLLAAPAYLVMLPFTLALGQHVFMNYCIRFCDHFGRLLSLIGLNPVRER